MPKGSPGKNSVSSNPDRPVRQILHTSLFSIANRVGGHHNSIWICRLAGPEPFGQDKRAVTDRRNNN